MSSIKLGTGHSAIEDQALLRQLEALNVRVNIDRTLDASGASETVRQKIAELGKDGSVGFSDLLWIRVAEKAVGGPITSPDAIKRANDALMGINLTVEGLSTRLEALAAKPMKSESLESLQRYAHHVQQEVSNLMFDPASALKAADPSFVTKLGESLGRLSACTTRFAVGVSNERMKLLDRESLSPKEQELVLSTFASTSASLGVLHGYSMMLSDPAWKARGMAMVAQEISRLQFGENPPLQFGAPSRMLTQQELAGVYTDVVTRLSAETQVDRATITTTLFSVDPAGMEFSRIASAAKYLADLPHLPVGKDGTRRPARSEVSMEEAKALAAPPFGFGTMGGFGFGLGGIMGGFG